MSQETREDKAKMPREPRIELEEGLTLGGLALAAAGLAVLWGLAVMALVVGTVLFGLGVGLAIYKGAR